MLVPEDNQQAIEKIKEAEALQEEIREEYLKRQKESLNEQNSRIQNYYDGALKLHQHQLDDLNGKLLYLSPNNLRLKGKLAPIDDQLKGIIIPDVDVIERQLLKDGLIKKPSKLKIEFNDKGMKINGKKQPVYIYQKYKALYENLNKMNLSGKNRIRVD